LNVNICPECGVPEPFNQGQTWLDNGDIVQRVNEEARIAFMECENLDPLFKGVVNISSRGTKAYMNRLFPEEVKNMLRTGQLQPEIFAETIMNYCHVIGYGRYEQVDYRYQRDEDDFSIFHIYEPFSVPAAAGAIIGVISAMVGGEHAVSYEEISPGLYQFTTRWTEYSEVLKEKMKLHAYRHKEGDVELERCSTCGCPKALCAYRWDLGMGTIKHDYTGRRMAVLGPEMLDPLFAALEAELGETIPRAVVEAQRRFVRTGFYSMDVVQAEEDLRTQLALRGLGNLRKFKIDKKGAHLRLSNACLHLMLTGLLQGHFETAFDVESVVDWELSQEGNLEVEVKPKAAV